MRILDRRFTEIDLADPEAKEKMRSAPVLDEKTLLALWQTAPPDAEAALTADDNA
jgi:hypothetical protein